MMWLSVILLCYRIACLWFCNKRLYNKKRALFGPDTVYPKPVYFSFFHCSFPNTSPFNVKLETIDIAFLSLLLQLIHFLHSGQRDHLLMLNLWKASHYTLIIKLRMYSVWQSSQGQAYYISFLFLIQHLLVTLALFCSLKTWKCLQP